MEESQALAGLSALAQETRLRILRQLVRAGPDGLAAGLVAESVAVSASNVSFHLKELERAGLVAQRRVARSIIYTADFTTLAALIGFLMQDCCNGRPDICAPAIASIACCPAPTPAKMETSDA
jgi:DNA-binding transcriptional ArsR family regulator